MKDFESSLPQGFYEPIKQTVKTMDNSRKGVKVGDKNIVDPEIIYARALALKCVNPDFDFEEILGYKLAPHPTSMFDEDGLLRTCKQKSKLMTTLKVEIPARLAANDADAIFLDGYAIIWVVTWPDKGTVEEYLNNFRRYLLEKAKIADMFLVFDRYYDESIKGLTRKYRDNGTSRVYQLTPVIALPPRDVVLKVTENKVQLIQLIVQNLVRNPAIFHGRHKLIVYRTGSSSSGNI